MKVKLNFLKNICCCCEKNEEDFEIKTNISITLYIAEASLIIHKGFDTTRIFVTITNSIKIESLANAVFKKSYLL